MADVYERRGLRLAAGAATTASGGTGRDSERRPKARKLVPWARDLRLKLLSLLLLSALGPVLLVGAASFFIARSIMTEKIASQLEVQASWGAERMASYLEHRSAEVRVFSEAAIVAEKLGVWAWAEQSGDAAAANDAQAWLRRYLEQIADRYPLYGILASLDAHGDVVAASAPVEGPVADLASAFAATGRDRLLVRDAGGVSLALLREVGTSEGAPLGTLIAVCSLDELWRELAGGPYPDSYYLRALDADGVPLFEAQPAVDQPAWDQLRREPTAEYRRADGRAVLGALRSLEALPASILVETDRAVAFAPIYRLRGFTLGVSIVATLLVAAIGAALVVSLMRPIEALIAGAKAAARGDLSQEIPVSSADQIGYLTRVFNHMIRTVRESRARLELLSRTDALTGLPNRRVLASAFDAELERAERFDDSLSVLMIDLDRFKAFNDRHGHQAGDEVLQFVGSFLSACLRSIDVAARYGGEEFLVLLPSTDSAGAVELAERLRRGFKRAGRKHGGGASPVTLSVGVASFPADGATADELVHAADKALYDAKRDGRDRVRAAPSVTPLRAVAPARRGAMP